MKYVSSLENRDFYSLKNSGTFKQNSQHHVKQSADSERERSCLGTENKTFTFDNQKKKKVEAEVESPLIPLLEPQGQLKN